MLPGTEPRARYWGERSRGKQDMASALHKCKVKWGRQELENRDHSTVRASSYERKTLTRFAFPPTGQEAG